MVSMHTRLRILEIYAAGSLLAFGVTAFSAFTQAKQKIDELTVERLNVVEKNGQLVAVMANTLSDRNGGSAFRVKPGAAKIALIRD